MNGLDYFDLYYELIAYTPSQILTFTFVEMHNGNAFVPVFRNLLLEVDLRVHGNVTLDCVIQLPCQSALGALRGQQESSNCGDDRFAEHLFCRVFFQN